MSVHDTRNDTEATQRNQFGTFGGVFTPCLLTILGVILFMRSNFVVGQAGIVGAVAILLLAKSITFFTALSTSAISTNMTVRGGGAYYLISRVLGPEFGGAIGIMLFLAQGVSVPFYALGFAEAVTQTFPVLREHGQAVAFATAACLFVVTYVGARWAIKVQYGIMAVLAASIFVFLAGSACVSRRRPSRRTSGRPLLRLMPARRRASGIRSGSFSPSTSPRSRGSWRA